MEIKTLSLGAFSTNCYLISDDSAAVVVDPGYDSYEVVSFLKENVSKEKLIVLTHAHYDHISAACEIAEITNTKIAIGEYENSALSDPQINLSRLFGDEIAPFSAEILLTDNQQLNIGKLKFTVWHTPGHTVGGICILADDVIFSGDTLFYESIGRTDFPGGDFEKLRNSIIRIYGLNEDVVVYPGHGPATTVGHEKLFNPYVR